MVLCKVKFCHPATQASVEIWQVLWCHCTQFWWTQWHMPQLKMAHSSICAWCVPSSYRWYSYLGNTQATSRHSFDLHKVSYLPQSYATPAHKAWSVLASGGFKQAEPHSSPSWRQITVITWRLKNVTRNMLQKTTCRQLLYVVQP